MIVNLPLLQQREDGTKVGAWIFVAVLCACNALNYADRSAIGGLVPAIDGEWGDTHAFDGTLSSVFMLSFGVASFAFAAFAARTSPFAILLCGMSIWVGAALVAGFATSPEMLLGARIFSGTAEATLQTVGPPMMQNVAERFGMMKCLPWWLGLFTMMMNVGLAVGTAWAGALGANWRQLFLVEAIAMAPLCVVLFAWLVHDRRVRASSIISEGLLDDGAHATAESSPRWHGNAVGVLRNKVWVLTTLGYSTQLACQNGAAFWMPKFLLEKMDGATQAKVTTLVGTVGLAAGVAGTMYSMWLSSRKQGGDEKAYLRSQFKLMLGYIACALCCFAMLLTMVRTATIPALLLTFAFFYATTVPNMMLYLKIVKPRERPFSMALGILIPHLLGDVPSPIISGWIWDACDSGADIAMWFLGAWGLLALPLWFIALKLYS